MKSVVAEALTRLFRSLHVLSSTVFFSMETSPVQIYTGCFIPFYLWFFLDRNGGTFFSALSKNEDYCKIIRPCLAYVCCAQPREGCWMDRKEGRMVYNFARASSSFLSPKEASLLELLFLHPAEDGPILIAVIRALSPHHFPLIAAL